MLTLISQSSAVGALFWHGMALTCSAYQCVTASAWRLLEFTWWNGRIRSRTLIRFNIANLSMIATEASNITNILDIIVVGNGPSDSKSHKSFDTIFETMIKLLIYRFSRLMFSDVTEQKNSNKRFPRTPKQLGPESPPNLTEPLDKVYNLPAYMNMLPREAKQAS